MDFSSAGLYGIIQGLTEFLPVSSSGHLALLPQFLSIDDPGMIFDLTMHVGTALAITFYFWREIKQIVSDFIFFSLGKKEKLSDRYHLSLNMALSTTATFVLVFLFQSLFWGDWVRGPKIIATNLALFGLFMLAADWYAARKEKSLTPAFAGGEAMVHNFQVKKSLWIGIFQAFAIFPGVSRSGATLTISRFLGLSRLESSRYSFLLSLPIIYAGLVYKLPELATSTSTFSLKACAFGLIVSFGVGLLTIHYFLKLIQKFGLGVYSVYRWVLAFLILYFL